MGHPRKRQDDRRAWWAAGAVALGLHVAIFMFMPPFAIDSFDGKAPSRMIVVTGPWQAAVCTSECPNGAAPYDTVDSPPQLANGPTLNYELSRVYPRTLWRYREPSAAVLEVILSHTGDVEAVSVIESSDNGADGALRAITRRMRFDLPDKYGEGLAGQLRVEIRPPR